MQHCPDPGPPTLQPALSCFCCALRRPCEIQYPLTKAMSRSCRQGVKLSWHGRRPSTHHCWPRPDVPPTPFCQSDFDTTTYTKIVSTFVSCLCSLFIPHARPLCGGRYLSSPSQNNHSLLSFPSSLFALSLLIFR